MRTRALFMAFAVLMALASGCGRKLPPLPAALPDPVEVISIGFDGAEVVAKARCNMDEAALTLLGKPKGMCPGCTDDLEVKQTFAVAKPGEVVLKDSAPQSDYMVYRIAAEHGATRWLTPARIVVKK